MKFVLQFQLQLARSLAVRFQESEATDAHWHASRQAFSEVSRYRAPDARQEYPGIFIAATLQKCDGRVL
jgi:hypothetical protein